MTNSLSTRQRTNNILQSTYYDNKYTTNDILLEVLSKIEGNFKVVDRVIVEMLKLSLLSMLPILLTCRNLGNDEIPIEASIGCYHSMTESIKGFRKSSVTASL